MDNSNYWALKPVLTFKEGCKYTGISESRMYKHTSNRDVPFYKPRGKMIYFRREELEAWLLRNRSASNHEIEREATKMAL